MIGTAYTADNEGCRLAAYRDTLGVWTIGYGCTGPEIGPGTVWSQDQAEQSFSQRYELAAAQAQRDLGDSAWFCLDPARQAALTDMAYQLGGTGLAAFARMLAALRAGDWLTARNQCLDSRYARQTPARAARNAAILLSGEWPAPF